MSAGIHTTRVEPSFSPAEVAPADTLRFTFTGSGREYFRIWLVNLCLTIVTLGIYSAWAKVRRLQYFDRNTRLGNAVFDFHGDPKAILKGRLVAVGLLAAYHYAFGFSRVFGAVVVCFLLVALPWLMRSALRFRLRNTSYRALRFDFDGSAAGAYLAYGPVMLLFLVPPAIVAWNPANAKWAGISGSLYFLWPWIHARIKSYQHANLCFGSAHASYVPQTKKFFSAYWRSSLLGSLMVAVAGILMALILPAVGAKGGWVIAVVVFVLLAVGGLFYLFAGPYLQARIANLVWSNTSFPHAQISSDIKPWGYMKLQAVNAVLTLLTLGLYRPFAVVRAYRYRLDAVTIQGDFAFERITAAEGSHAAGTSGDSAADFFGFDLSW